MCRCEPLCIVLQSIALSEVLASGIFNFIVGSFEDDIDVCELFCRIELYCEAWCSILMTTITTYWTKGYCIARGPPSPNSWQPTNHDIISGRKSFTIC